ncbi:MAG TPA: isochorismatase family cysteine hydrolase [Trueperaceae bacterium]
MKRIFHHEVLDRLDEIVAPSRTAVLIIDVQNDFCSPGGAFDKAGKNLESIRAMLAPLAEFLERARKIGVPLVYIQQTTLPEGKSDSPAWLRLKTRDGKDGQYTILGTWGHDFVDMVKPRSGDTVVRKWRSSAFTRTELDRLLKESGVETVILTGTTTQGCVESTGRDATFHDYYAVLPVDLVATTNKELHEASLRVQAARHELTTSAEIIAAWQRTSAGSDGGKDAV